MTGWRPPLEVRERGGRCVLSLGGALQGEGDTLQEAADDLVGRLLKVAFCYRRSGFAPPAELGAFDLRWVEFFWELGELAARGGDVRERALGVPSDAFA
jgi:hypothetical protein